MDRELFVQNVKTLCSQRHELPTIVCKKAGVGGSFISDINRGRTPSIAKVQKLADYFGVSTSQLLGETALPSVAPTPSLDNHLHQKSDFRLSDFIEPKLSKTPAIKAEFQAAFWGGEKDLTQEDLDELWEDVSEYARYKAEQRRKKKQNDGPD